jgi:hypothetical protein
MSDDAPGVPPVPLADVSLRVASALDTADEVFYLQSMGAILAKYPQLSVDDYWRLTCAEHAALMLYADPKRASRGS